MSEWLKVCEIEGVEEIQAQFFPNGGLMMRRKTPPGGVGALVGLPRKGVVTLMNMLIRRYPLEALAGPQLTTDGEQRE